jgi:hypothetical protein
LKTSVNKGFMSDWQMDLICVDGDPVALLEKLVQTAGLASEAVRLDQI